MTHTAHSPIPNLRTRRPLVVAAVIIAIVVAVAAVVAQRTADVGSTDAPRAGSPAVVAPKEFRDYARTHDLAGLSPAGLTQRGGAVALSSDSVAAYKIYREIARYANTHGLTGLSPASLAQEPQQPSIRQLEHAQQVRADSLARMEYSELRRFRNRAPVTATAALDAVIAQLKAAIA